MKIRLADKFEFNVELRDQQLLGVLQKKEKYGLVSTGYRHVNLSEFLQDGKWAVDGLYITFNKGLQLEIENPDRFVGTIVEYVNKLGKAETHYYPYTKWGDPFKQTLPKYFTDHSRTIKAKYAKMHKMLESWILDLNSYTITELPTQEERKLVWEGVFDREVFKKRFGKYYEELVGYRDIPLIEISAQTTK